jgi:transposase
MHKPQYTVGIDIASETFAATILDEECSPVNLYERGINTPEGFFEFLQWLHNHDALPDTAIMCMEATGTYGEQLCYYLASQAYRVAVIQPLKVKRSDTTTGHKTDAIDSRRIAEYARRYYDKLTFWEPNTELVEQIKTLFTTREHLSKQMVTHKNTLHIIKRKHYRTPLAEQTHGELIDDLKARIITVEREIKRLIKDDPSLKNMYTLLLSIPGVGFCLSVQLLCITNGFTREINAKQLASYAGICPLKKESGTYLHPPDKSRRYGPSALRKLLFLAALSLRTHNRSFQHYFLRKTQQGKPKRLVINNIANKLLKLICAILRSQKPFIPNYRSVNPLFLKNV